MLRLSQIWPMRSLSGWLLCHFEILHHSLSTSFSHSKMFQVPPAQSLTEPWNQPLLLLEENGIQKPRTGIQMFTFVFKVHSHFCVCASSVPGVHPNFLSPFLHDRLAHCLHKYCCKEQPSARPLWTCVCIFMLISGGQIPPQNARPCLHFHQWSMSVPVSPLILVINQLPNFCQMNKCAGRAHLNLLFSDYK